MGDKSYNDLHRKMQNNSAALISQSTQLERTKALGIEAHENLKWANIELQRQGTKMVEVREKNLKLGKSLQRSGAIIETLSFRVFARKAMLWVLAILFMIIDLAVIYIKIFY